MYQHTENKSIKVVVLEFINSFKYLIVLVYTIVGGLLVYNLMQPNFLRIVVAIAIAIYLITFLKSLPRGFCTTHNMAQLTYRDTLLDRTYFPGDFLFLLPGYRVVEHKGAQLLDTNVLRMVIKHEIKETEKNKNIEVQFKKDSVENPDAKDSLIVKNINIYYSINRDKIYNFLMDAPGDYEDSVIGNIIGDIAKAFKNRIATLHESQEFTDLTYIDPQNPRDDIQTPKYAKKAGMYIYIDEAKGEKWPSFILDKNGEPDVTLLYLPELNSTLEKASSFGINITKVDIEGFKDSDKTDDLRNSVKQQDFINETNDKVTENRRSRTEKYKKDFIADGFNPKVATIMALKQILAEEGKLQVYDGDASSNLLISPEKTK